jgi:hypothetical protein
MVTRTFHTRVERPSPYFYGVRRPVVDFWRDVSLENRKVLFIFGLGFDPRCVPGMKAMVEAFTSNRQIDTVCARFTNHLDRDLPDNQRYTRESLHSIRSLRRHLDAKGLQHYEIEVNLFKRDGTITGDSRLLEEFEDIYGGSRLDSYTDILVDISAFPRSLIYTLLAHLWRRRRYGQNLYACLTDGGPNVITVTDFTSPAYWLVGERGVEGPKVWIPVLGSDVERFQAIYEFLRPDDVYPIVPFPAANPRSGDDILLSARRLFDQWDVPFGNVMYASGDVPFDVFRKIHDIVSNYEGLKRDLSIVVTPLAGRTLSLGVLLAALWCDLDVCHVQPTTYTIAENGREALKRWSETAVPTLYWLNGSIYE